MSEIRKAKGWVFKGESRERKTIQISIRIPPNLAPPPVSRPLPALAATFFPP